MSIQSSTIQLPVGDKSVDAYLAAPENGGPGVLVLHAWWGLKPFFKQVCERLAAEGFVALAPDLYNGPVATTVEAAQELLEASDGQLTRDTIIAARDALHAHPSTRTGKIGVLGFSMGAAWALVAATRAPELFSAVVVYYGVAELDPNKLKAAFLGHYSDVDEWEPLEGVRAMQAAMQAAGVDATFHIYPGQAHWFVEDDRPEYNAAAAELSWARTFDFLKQNV
jgi:carboxymethylenebutenolidase